MDRRKSIKALVAGTVSAGILLEACNPVDKNTSAPIQRESTDNSDRMPEEIAYNKKLEQEKYFTDAEMATITVLADIIIPRDEFSGSASDAKVPEFIEFIVKDQPEHQTPMRGGLRWLDLHSLKKFEKSFTALNNSQQLEMVNEIAYPNKANPDYRPGVSFFNLMRNLTMSGFYTTEMGFKDLGYVGNRPNQWNGVPDEVLKQYQISYSEKELKECIRFDKS
jgi:gluconate 2-dehydrogenase gamma chain